MKHTWKIERKIVARVRRYRVALEDVLSRCLAGDVRTAVRRLSRGGRLRAHVHDSGLHYLTMPGKPGLSPGTLARALSMFSFCHATGWRRTLLTQAEIQQYFPHLFRHGMPGGHYIDTPQF